MIQMPRLVSLLLIVTLIVVLGLMFYQVVVPFLMPLFLAAVLAILCQPLHQRFLGWTKNRTALAAALTTAVVLASMLGPLITGTVAAARHIDRVTRSRMDDRSWRAIFENAKHSETVKSLVTRYGQLTGDPVQFDEIEKEIDERFREVAQLVAKKTLGAAGATFSLLGAAVGLLISALTFVIAFYYFLADGPDLVEATVKLIPVNPDYQRQLISQFDQSVRAVVLATFAAAIGQGIATGIGMEITEQWHGARIAAALRAGLPAVDGDVQLGGFSYFFVATILATLTALVPLLGTWLVWGTYAAWLWYLGHWGPATFITVYGIVVVGLLDNVIRTYVLQSNVKLHPLLAFISVLGGVQALGLWGVFVGPIVASCLHALVRIFNSELLAFTPERTLRRTMSDDVTTMLMPALDVKKAEQAGGDLLPKSTVAAPSGGSSPAASATAPQSTSVTGTASGSTPPAGKAP